MTRHPDPHKAMGQALKEARGAFGPTVQPRDLPSRNDRFALVPEDEFNFWPLFCAIFAGIMIGSAIAIAFQWWLA